MSILSFSEGYRQYFEVIPATTAELKRQSYRLRHEVYCRDLGYEPEREDELETDAYDQQSVHCLIRALSSGTFVGCARIVLTGNEGQQRLLPFEEACQDTLDRRIIEPWSLDRTKIAEISRLAILGRYRRRKGESGKPFSLDTHPEEGRQLRLPYLPVALYLALLALARRQGIETLFVLTDPRLAISINRLGGELTQIGQPIEHRGTRIPSMMSVSTTIGGMNRYVRAFFDTIAEEISQGLSSVSTSASSRSEIFSSLLRA